MYKLPTIGWFLLLVVLLVALVNLATAQETPTMPKGHLFYEDVLPGPAGSVDTSVVEILAELQYVPVPGGSSPIELQIPFSSSARHLDFSGRFVGVPRPMSPTSAVGANCTQLLANSKLDVTGNSIAPWVILDPIVYFSTSDYVSPQHSVLFVDNDSGDSSPTQDAFAQAFTTPSQLTGVAIRYNTMSVNSNTADYAHGNLFTVDTDGELEQFLGSWEVGQSTDAWHVQNVEITDSAVLQELSDEDLAIVFFNSTTASAPNEVVFFDDITFTACRPASSAVYFPAQEEAPGLGWRAGNQVQNSGSEEADMTFTGYEPDGEAVECEGQSASPGASVTFLTDYSCPQDHELFVSSVIRSDQSALAISNISNRGVGLASGQYRGTTEKDTADTLFFPLVKNDHNGRTTGFFVQNVSDGPTDIGAVFRVQGQSFDKVYKDIPAYTSIFILPGDAAVPPGFGQVGSLTVVSPRPIAGTSLEFEEEVSIADNIQVASGFTPADSADTLYCPLFRHLHAKKQQTTGVQVQNVSEASQRVDFTYVPIGGGSPVVASEQVAAGASTTFYAPELGIPEGSVGSVTIEGEAELVAVVNDQGYDQGQRNMATYTCFPEHQVSNQIYVPLYKELYGGNTSGIQIQNVSGDGSSTKVTLTYRVRNSNTAVSFTHENPIADGGSITFWNVSDLASPADIQLLAGDPALLAKTVGSVEITADKPIVAIVNENSYGPNASGQDAKNYEGFNSIFPGKGLIEYEDLVISHLAHDHTDTWVVPVDEATELTVTVAPAAAANIILSILDENGNALVDQQDYAPAGEVETIVDFYVSNPGYYRIQISSDSPISTDYALLALDENSYDFRFQGTLESGVPQNDAVDAESDHFWFFSAQEGDNLSMQITPDQNGDAYVELWGPDSTRLLTIDDQGAGEAEVLNNYAIQSPGMYPIRVGEFDFSSMSYSIIIELD